jgi:murein L,D-transpeptidase YafK
MHQMQMQYDDHFFIGDFPNPDVLAEREPSRLYKEHAVDLTVKFLQKHNKEFSLQCDNWDELKGTSWQVHGIDNINELKFAIFDHLADSIVVKESKFRPRIEQRIRKSAAREYFSLYSDNWAASAMREEASASSSSTTTPSFGFSRRRATGSEPQKSLVTTAS